MDNKNRNIVIILVSLAAVVILVICYFLFFTTSTVVEEDYPKVEIYKYEIASGKYKYYLEKLDASKIALKDSIKYKCNNESCQPAATLYAEGNISNDLVLIKDENLIILDYIKNEKITITEVKDFDFVNFINDGKYVLISNDSFYKIFDIENQELSEPFKSDVLVTKDEKPFIILGKYIVNIDNGKYGIINMKTGNNIYDNEYDYIDCKNNYCIFSSKDKSTVYDISKEEDNVLIQSADRILYNDDKYIIYSLNEKVTLLNVDTLDTQVVELNNNVIINSLTDKLIGYTDKDKCYNYVLKDDSKKSIDCSDNKYHTDIFASVNAKTTISIKSSDKFYDLKTNNTKLYDNSGNYYDYVSIETNKDDTVKGKYTVNVTSDNAYDFLETISERLELTDFEKTVFINRWLPELVDNKSSYVELLFISDFDRLPGIKVLTDKDVYVGVILNIHKGSKETVDILDDIKIEPIKRKGVNIVSLTGISY